MAVQFSPAVRNLRLNAIETGIGASAILKIRTGAAPANCAAADAGNVLATLALPADYFGDAAAGVKAKAGTWTDASADATGTAGHWRLYASDGVTCHAQGEIVESPASGSLVLDNTDIAITQPVTINSFSLTEGNA